MKCKASLTFLSLDGICVGEENILHRDSFSVVIFFGTLFFVIDGLKRQLAAGNEITFRVKVRPSARVSRFRGPLGEDTFKVDIAAVPEDGKANDELIRFLAEEFSVSRHKIEIVYGEMAKMKIVRISI